MTQQFNPTLTGRPTDYLDGNGAFSPILDPTQYSFFFDDFLSCVKSTTNNGKFLTGGIGLTWGQLSTGTCSCAGVTPSDSGCIGSIVMTAGPASGNNISIVPSLLVAGTSFAAAMSPLNTVQFDFKFRVAIPTTTTVQVLAGFSDGTTQATYIRYDTSLSDTTWTAFTTDGTSSSAVITGSVLDTNYHTLRIRSVTPGTLLYSVDGGTEVSLSTHIPTTCQLPVLQIITKAAVNRTFKCDYVWGWIKLAR